MRTLVAGVAVAVLGCAPSLQSRVSSGNRASVTSAAAEAQRTARMMETAKRECAAAREKGLSTEEETATSQRLLTRWLAPAKPDEKPRETRAEVRVTKVGQSLVAHASAPGASWVFLVEESAEVDSFSVPSGTVLVTRGLVDLATSDAQLAGALAHEMAHVTLRHQLKSLAQQEELACQVRRLGELVLADEASREVKDSGSRTIMTAAADGSLTRGNPSATTTLLGKKLQADASQETEADAAAARTLHAAGLDVGEFIALIPKFAATSTPMLTVPKRVEALEAVRASLPPLKPAVPPKPAAPVKKPKR
ncbi:MAG: M48 family metallopeptidase [Myxococcales bacterium]|nr:M48 family metallopeptidase [Myxococcales bacterium]